MIHIELKPCPFCGNKIAPKVATIAELKGDPMCEFDAYEYDKHHYAVVCDVNNDEVSGCGASTGYYSESPESAIKLWNRRAENG